MSDVVLADATEVHPPGSAQRMIVLASGLLVMFAAFGFGSWICGAACWIGFYLGARGQALVWLARMTTCVGFAAAVAATLMWYWRRCRRGATDIPARAVVTACLI